MFSVRGSGGGGLLGKLKTKNKDKNPAAAAIVQH